MSVDLNLYSFFFLFSNFIQHTKFYSSYISLLYEYHRFDLHKNVHSWVFPIISLRSLCSDVGICIIFIPIRNFETPLNRFTLFLPRRTRPVAGGRGCWGGRVRGEYCLRKQLNLFLDYAGCLLNFEIMSLIFLGNIFKLIFCS